ncbi:Arylacetonitrilase [Exophiala dermatitidis]
MGNSTSPATLRVAAAQYEPEWLDLQASVAKTCAIIEEAGKKGVKVLGFSEAFIPGYPAWIWQRPLDPVLSTKYIQNSLAVDSDEMRTIQKCSAENGVVVALGFSENDHNSVYIAQALIDSDGKLLMTRRKLKPTHMERTIFGDASGDSLRNGALTKIGKRSYQQLNVHGSFADNKFVLPGDGLLTWCLSLAQTYAVETQTFVLHATTVISSKGVDAMSTAQSMLMNKPGGGYSAVIGPDGRRLTEPLDPSTEGLVIADVDPNMAIMARSFLDICGHYSRPDLLWLGCDTRERRHKIDEAGAVQAAAQKGAEEENE